jgi:hypothetical protein
VDAVLGLSVTPSAVGLVLVEDPDGDGAARDAESFEVRTHGLGERSSERAAEAVRRTEALAADRGSRVHSIGVTWSDDADAEASMLLRSLSDSGFDNIVAVRQSEATDALARGLADVMGYATLAVCVVEPDHLLALVVAADEGAVQTAVNHSVVTEEDLVGWLSTVFTRADWQPEALVLVGSAEDLDALVPVLGDALSVPVFSPAEAQLALARGAALACTTTADLDLWPEEHISAAPAQRPRDRLARTAPAALLIGGVVVFVASVSAALGLQFAPHRPAAPVKPAAEVSAPLPAAPPPVAPPAPPEPTAAAPAEPAPVTDTPVDTPAPVDTAPPAGDPPPADAPPVDAQTVDAPPVDAAPVDPAPVLEPAPAVDPAAVAPPVVPPVPEQKPGLLQRIKDRLAGIHDEPAPPPAPAPPLP